jgi:Zn-dependent protease with chaperone function
VSGEIVKAGGAPPGRIRFPGISPRAYEHPADRGALVALRAVPGFDAVLKALSGAVGERSHRLLALASSVRVSPRQYPELDRLRNECAVTLDVDPIPELYVVRDPLPNAMTLGLDKPFMTITTGMLELTNEAGNRFVIGHEMGHVLSGHAVYRTMLLHLVRLATGIAWMPIGYWGVRAIVAALQEWYRKSELSCDRAGLLCTQDPQGALRVHALLAGATTPDEMDVAAFLAQAQEYDASGDIRDSVLKLMHLDGRTHPLAALRAAELQKWAASEAYRTILAGQYPRRADDASTSWSDEVKAAAASYRDSFSESSDPLKKVVTSASRMAGRAWRGAFGGGGGANGPNGPAT